MNRIDEERNRGSIQFCVIIICATIKPNRLYMSIRERKICLNSYMYVHKCLHNRFAMRRTFLHFSTAGFTAFLIFEYKGVSSHKLYQRASPESNVKQPVFRRSKQRPATKWQQHIKKAGETTTYISFTKKRQGKK